jgi:hypothetical protein
LSAFGAVAVWQFTQEIKWPKKIGRILKRYPKAQLSWFLALIAVVYLGRFGEYLHEYYVEFPVYAARDWQYGYEEAVKYAKSKESEVDKIVITSTYGQPHIFTYFYQERDPMEIFWGQMGMYLFREVDWDGDQFMQRTLLVGTHEEIPENIPGNAGKIVKEVYFPDGSVAFRIAQTKGEE